MGESLYARAAGERASPTTHAFATRAGCMKPSQLVASILLPSGSFNPIYQDGMNLGVHILCEMIPLQFSQDDRRCGRLSGFIFRTSSACDEGV